MNTKVKMPFAVALAVVCLLCASVSAGMAADAVKLPPPVTSGGMPLCQAFAERSSSREFADVELSPEQLSNLLWATAGINRDSGKRTYPVGMGRYDMSLYVFTKSGVYLYQPDDHTLLPVAGVNGDRRADTGGQPFVAQAAVDLVYVHDMRLWQSSKEEREDGSVWGYVHAGAMMENAYLYATSQSWSVVVRGMFDGQKLRNLLGLPPEQNVVLTQSIGPGK